MYGSPYGSLPYDRPQIVASGGGTPSGTLAVTEAADIAAFTGTYSVQGILTVTEGPDILAFSGTGVVSGTLSTTETADTLAFTGTAGVAGILSVTEGVDIAAFTATFVGAAITGTLAATEAFDILAFVSATGGGGKYGVASTWQKGMAKRKSVHEYKPPTLYQPDDVQKAAAHMSSLGGHARAKSLSASERTKIATIAAKTRWK